MICENCISYEIEIEDHPTTGLPIKAKKVCKFPELHFKRMTSEGVSECTGFAETKEDWNEKLSEIQILNCLGVKRTWSFRRMMEYLFGECLDYSLKTSHSWYPKDEIVLRGGK